MGNFLSSFYFAINVPNFSQCIWITFLLFFNRHIFLKMTAISCPIRNNLSLWGWKRRRNKSLLDDGGVWGGGRLRTKGKEPQRGG